MKSKQSSATVLVVDDQEMLRRLMCKTLETAGFRVLAADNGENALSVFRSAEPPVDLLVTDYRMPGMTGLELARECCDLDAELSVLYVSGSGPGDELQTDLAAERRRFLAKPFRQSELLHTAHAVLTREPAAARGSQASV
jgi:CheY-like chemotaxis protein